MIALKLLYHFCYDGFNFYSDPRTKDFFLTSNLLYTLALLAVYYKFVTSWGPRYMKDRKPFELKAVLTAYNLLQIFLCIRMVYMGSQLYLSGSYSFICEPVDYSNSELGLLAAKEVHNYFLVKVLDLLDTVFFVLRKKQRQVTFLHVYHHTIMVLTGWLGVRFIPGGHSLSIGYINAYVHVIMYTYYLYASHTKSSQIWWKKYITLIQIIQFGLLSLQWGLLLISEPCGYPKKAAILFFPQAILMVAMFVHFYYKTYIVNKVK